MLDFPKTIATLKPQAASRKPQQLCNVDLLRGLAAVLILIWHYQHFYFPEAGIRLSGWAANRQPLFVTLKWAYLYGWWAVQFFWILSGFIFFHVYGQQRDVSIREFFCNRFSRLYPCHFLTLCLVAILQVISLFLCGHFQIYPKNDLYHFFLNLFFASHWGFQKGFSFNAPIWSISVEVVVYALFFVYLKITKVNFISGAAWFIASLFLYKIKSTPILECAAFFSLGGAVQQASEFVRQRWGALINLVMAVVVVVGTFAFLTLAKLPPRIVAQWILFPAIIWLASALDRMNISSGCLGTTLGHLTYASYLIHIPIQIVTIIILDSFIGSRSAVDSPEFFIGFIVIVLSLAWLVYKYIERPAQFYLRKKMMSVK
jgi:peptidoglycan/LPS O-acetylase OafA/YrhL